MPVKILVLLKAKLVARRAAVPPWQRGQESVRCEEGQVGPTSNEAEQMAHGAGVVPLQQSLASSTGSQAHPRGISPVFERADAPFPQNTGIGTFSRRRNAGKRNQTMQKKKKNHHSPKHQKRVR